MSVHIEEPIKTYSVDANEKENERYVIDVVKSVDVYLKHCLRIEFKPHFMTS